MSEKVAYKPGLDYLLGRFLPSTFARKISKLSETGELLPPPPSPARPSPARKAYNFKKYLESGATIKVTNIYNFMCSGHCLQRQFRL